MQFFDYYQLATPNSHTRLSSYRADRWHYSMPACVGLRNEAS
ncbi:hypothetical protein GPLA_2386 [Paraglaciecola polaris LMG 21857]|uniref:Uncharacterized protein n=1 Tax=Paraglaciecola polaris LMG 21857 TaxID=1129793 RepID=K6ZB31_9ALTE|nr:hypothetical protein GPLA_2386 [Paraglaciecola polaris LMG 21857]